MGRKVASQVHNAATRLMQGKLLPEPPLWYSAVARYPPLPLPPRKAVRRSKLDLPPGSRTTEVEEGEEATSTGAEKLRKEPKPRVMPVVYLEDKVRQRFFLDHPFEAFRPRSLVEEHEIQKEHPIQGPEWTRLRQRGRNPNSEDCIKFAVSLHIHHSLPLSQAYRTACQQYAALRSEHTISSHIAYLEAKALGATFTASSSIIRRGYDLEEAALTKWKKGADEDMNEQVARKKWRPVFEKQQEDVGRWTQGEEYVHKAKQGEIPTYKAGN
ncbi:hypothetical protein CPB86DRAFT_682663, partial [Serendipita vermifera]